MTPIVLTFAELAVLLKDASAARERLHLREWDADSPVVAAGVASLVVRGLVRENDSVFMPSDELTSIFDVVTTAVDWIEVGVARTEGGGGVQIFNAAAGRTQIRSQPFGTFVFTQMDPSIALEAAVAELVQTFLQMDEPGAVFVKTTPGADEAPEEGFAIRRLESGAIEVAQGDADTSEVSESTLDDALAELRRYLAPAGAGASA